MRLYSLPERASLMASRASESISTYCLLVQQLGWQRRRARAGLPSRRQRGHQRPYRQIYFLPNPLEVQVARNCRSISRGPRSNLPRFQQNLSLASRVGLSSSSRTVGPTLFSPKSARRLATASKTSTCDSVANLFASQPAPAAPLDTQNCRVCSSCGLCFERTR